MLTTCTHPLFTESPLIVIQKAKSCAEKNADGSCATAAIIRGQTSLGLPSVCYLRVDPGPCGRDLIRVYYDPRSARCKHFSYSGIKMFVIHVYHGLLGCGGNANRFVSIKNCYHICNPGYRTRLVGTEPPAEDSTTDACPPKEKKSVKLNVTSVEQIEVQMK